MIAILRPALALVGLFTLLLGLAVPLAFTEIAGAIFPGQASGSLVERDGKVIGSTLIGQGFVSDRYFHPRPSATTEADPTNVGGTRPAPYHAAAGAASQLGPTSAALLDAMKERIAAFGSGPVPADAVTASGSGLDPHITLENAMRQVHRVAAARGLPEERVRTVLSQQSEGPAFNALGQPRVNVLRLNLALDGLR